MNPWPTKKLGEVVVDLEKERIFTLDSDTFYTEPTISSKEHKILPKRTAKGNEFKVKRRIKLKPGDLVISKLHTQNGLFAYADREYASTTTFIPLKVKENLIDKKFLFYSLRIFIKKLGSVDTVGRETYSKEQILSLKIPVPPLPIQQKIVERLDAIKKAQELNDKQIELAEELFQSLLHRELDPKGKKWEIKKLGEYLVQFDRGISWSHKNERGSVAVLRIPNIEEGQINLNELKYIDVDGENGKLQKNDIVMVASNGNPDLVGRSALVTEREEGMRFASFLTRLKFDDTKLLPQYAHLFLLTLTFKRELRRKIATTSGIYNLRKEYIENIKISLPPLETQQKIVEKLSAVQEYKKKLLERKQKLQELFESVLDKSFKGELAE